MSIIASCQKFRHLLSNQCLPILGAFNGLVARNIAQHGFKACYISGAAISASSGEPDIGLLTRNSFCDIIKEVHYSSGLPVLADADTGFGEGEMCAKTVWEYFNNGAAGLHIEDQVFPKRCGHLDGKALIEVDAMMRKVEIAAESSYKCSKGSFIICARTDANGVYGLEETINRSKKYVDAGASMIFPEGLKSKEEFRIVAKELKSTGAFLLANMTEFGKTEYISLDEFSQMGYHCVIYPVTTLRVAMRAIDLFLKEMKEKDCQLDYLERMQSRQELYNLINYTPGEDWYYPSPINKQIEF